MVRPTTVDLLDSFFIIIIIVAMLCLLLPPIPSPVSFNPTGEGRWPTTYSPGLPEVSSFLATQMHIITSCMCDLINSTSHTSPREMLTTGL